MIIWRDILFYIIAVLMTIGFGIYGEITWWSATLLLLLYGALVLTVVISDRRKGKNKDSKQFLISCFILINLFMY
jgi:Ca2+/Na+ antiporter